MYSGSIQRQYPGWPCFLRCFLRWWTIWWTLSFFSVALKDSAQASAQRTPVLPTEGRVPYPSRYRAAVYWLSRPGGGGAGSLRRGCADWRALGAHGRCAPPPGSPLPQRTPGGPSLSDSTLIAQEQCSFHHCLRSTKHLTHARVRPHRDSRPLPQSAHPLTRRRGRLPPPRDHYTQGPRHHAGPDRPGPGPVPRTTNKVTGSWGQTLRKSQGLSASTHSGGQPSTPGGVHSGGETCGLSAGFSPPVGGPVENNAVVFPQVCAQLWMNHSGVLPQIHSLEQTCG